MPAFDASSIIYAWDNYPVLQFPGLWEWMSAKVQTKILVMPSVAFEEVMHKAPDCGHWLRDHQVKKHDIDNAILQKAMEIKQLLGIVGDAYHQKGVGENDILIIATARIHGLQLVSDERVQTQFLETPSKRKIPAVCVMPEVAVDCVNFVKFIKSSGVIFG